MTRLLRLISPKIASSHSSTMLRTPGVLGRFAPGASPVGLDFALLTLITPRYDAS